MKYNMILKNDLKESETDKVNSPLESIKFAFKRLIIFFHKFVDFDYKSWKIDS